MCKCLNCKYCKKGYEEDNERYCYIVKCMKTSNRGKTISWAYTTFDNNLKIKEYGKDRIKLTKTPKWCPDLVLEEFELIGVAVREGGLSGYTIENMFTYDNFHSLKDCINQLKIWTEQGYKILSYTIKKNKKIIENEYMCSALGIDIEKNRIKSLLQKDLEIFKKRLEKF